MKKIFLIGLVVATSFLLLSSATIPRAETLQATIDQVQAQEIITVGQARSATITDTYTRVAGNENGYIINLAPRSRIEAATMTTPQQNLIQDNNIRMCLLYRTTSWTSKEMRPYSLDTVQIITTVHRAMFYKDATHTYIAALGSNDGSVAGTRWYPLKTC